MSNRVGLNLALLLLLYPPLDECWDETTPVGDDRVERWDVEIEVPNDASSTKSNVNRGEGVT